MQVEVSEARRYAVISGKGGVGKSVISANLAAALTKAGKHTLVFDADLGLANLDVILGLNSSYTLHDVIHGRCSIGQAILTAPGGFDLLPAGSGVLEGTVITPPMSDNLEALLSDLSAKYDIILFDAGAGIGEVVLFFARMAHKILLVVTPELTSMMDAYATIKILTKLYGRNNISLIVNKASPDRPDQIGSAVAKHLQQVVSRFLVSASQRPLQLNLIGSIPRDPTVARAISLQQLLADTDPRAPSSLFISQLAKTLEPAVVA